MRSWRIVHRADGSRAQRSGRSPRPRLHIALIGLLPVFALLAGLPVRADEPFSVDPYVVEHDEEVAGHAMTHFVNDWWQWAHSMPNADSPIADATGAKCGVNQEGDVWYLAGGFGTSRITRSCTVPGGNHIFFPVINVLEAYADSDGATCDHAKTSVARNNDRFVYVRVRLDGSEIRNAERFRLASADCFDLFARVPASVNAPRYYPSATDGTWINLRPLPPGTHRLEFSAFYTNAGAAFGDMVQNIAYDLTVLAE